MTLVKNAYMQANPGSKLTFRYGWYTATGNVYSDVIANFVNKYSCRKCIEIKPGVYQVI